MGTGSSISARRDPVEQGTKNRSIVRERLHQEFGHNLDDDKKEIVKENSSMKLNEMPGVLKAKARFLKPLHATKQASKNTNLVKRPDNHALLKELYRRMDPSIMTSVGGKVAGELQLSIKYKYETSNLLVKIGRGKDLKMENAHKLPDPYVTVELLTPRNSYNNSGQTKQKWNTSKPIFQEIIAFALPESLIVDSKLKVTVWSKDKISEDDFLGEVILDLCKLDMCNGLAEWYSLHPEDCANCWVATGETRSIRIPKHNRDELTGFCILTDLTITGTIDVSIKHTVPNTLLVTLHEAHGLKPANHDSNTANPFVRCLITGIETRHVTKVAQETLDPVFDETFEFSLHKEELQFRVLVLNILSKERFGKDKRLGDVHVPLCDLEDGIMQRTSCNLSDLRNTPHSRRQWSGEGVAAEFREAMRAHIVYQFPRFLFKEGQKGKKSISVSSTKARTSAKVVVTDGFPDNR